MSDALLRHVHLERELNKLRGALAIGDPQVTAADEDRILDELEALWHAMSGEEQETLERHWPLKDGRHAPADAPDFPAQDVADHDRHGSPVRIADDAAAARDEVKRLVELARAALPHRRDTAERGEREPLSVWIEYTSDGVRISFPPSSRGRLGHQRHVALGVSIAVHELNQTGGDAGELLLESVVSLSRCTRDELRELGGLVFVSRADGRVLRSWPAAS